MRPRLVPTAPRSVSPLITCAHLDLVPLYCFDQVSVAEGYCVREQSVWFWIIEYVQHPPRPEDEGRLAAISMPIPSPTSPGSMDAALCVFESEEAARAFLIHSGSPSGQRPTPVRLEFIVRMLESQVEGNPDYAAINPIPSRYLADANGQATCLTAQGFLEALERGLQ